MWLDLLVIVVCFGVFGCTTNYLIEGLAPVRAAEEHGVVQVLRGDGDNKTHSIVAYAGALRIHIKKT